MKKFIILLYFILFSLPINAQVQAQQYIETHKDWAINAMNEFGVPASIVLAVAMYESGNGTSKVASYLNNHFGIRGANNNKQIKSSYKGYESVKDSYDDFICYLKSHKQFNPLFEKYSAYDYHSWAYGIMWGGYAGSKAWAAHIIAIIKKHQLFMLDNRPEGYLEPTHLEIEQPHTVSTALYIVKKGDTLGAIAKYHKTTVKNIRKNNFLRNDKLKIGQRLKI